MNITLIDDILLEYIEEYNILYGDLVDRLRNKERYNNKISYHLSDDFYMNNNIYLKVSFFYYQNELSIIKIIHNKFKNKLNYYKFDHKIYYTQLNNIFIFNVLIFKRER